jgi:hypothetical protein
MTAANFKVWCKPDKEAEEANAGFPIITPPTAEAIIGLVPEIDHGVSESKEEFNWFISFPAIAEKISNIKELEIRIENSKERIGRNRGRRRGHSDREKRVLTHYQHKLEQLQEDLEDLRGMIFKDFYEQAAEKRELQTIRQTYPFTFEDQSLNEYLYGRSIFVGKVHNVIWSASATQKAFSTRIEKTKLALGNNSGQALAALLAASHPRKGRKRPGEIPGYPAAGPVGAGRAPGFSGLAGIRFARKWLQPHHRRVAMDHTHRTHPKRATYLISRASRGKHEASCLKYRLGNRHGSPQSTAKGGR